MNWRKFTLIACAGSLCLTLSTWAINVSSSKFAKPQLAVTQLSIKQLEKQGQAITVKVISQDVLGSGILLKRQGYFYTVLTNAHVLRSQNPPYRIQTNDNRIWVADVPKTIRFGQNDLALLQFRSTGIIYSVASFGSSPTVGDEVFAGGFPSQEEETGKKGFALTTGKISLRLHKALEGGYQFGYTNDIEKGMSGGPLLNRRGEVVGVNGMHAYPLWDAPSVFVDGSEADAALHNKITHLSWAVPIETVIKLIGD
ncbi:S1 family peptidase [Tolypothrix sp. VBCCA 56010]|uniref:S1 family peptidase n=1 Tax=Tolypothrix sp. VBCCA 56010 TaxID=3137731 RepID=UPI003D7E762F